MSPHETKVQYTKLVLGTCALGAVFYVIFLLQNIVNLLTIIANKP